MLRLTPRAQRAADSPAARQVLVEGLRTMLALEGTVLAASLDPERLVVKGPLEVFTQPASSFLDKVPLNPSISHSFLYFLCHEQGPQAEARPVAICDLTGGPSKWEFGGVGQSELLNGKDLIGELVDEALRQAEAATPNDAVSTIVVWIPDAYEVILIDSTNEQPPLDMSDDIPVFRLDLARRVSDREGVERTSLGEIRTEVADMMARFQATLEEEP